MRDEIFDRDYQAGRDALHDGIDRLVAGIGQTFRVLAAIQFNAPWKNDADRRIGRRLKRELTMKHEPIQRPALRSRESLARISR